MILSHVSVLSGTLPKPQLCCTRCLILIKSFSSISCCCADLSWPSLGRASFCYWVFLEYTQTDQVMSQWWISSASHLSQRMGRVKANTCFLHDAWSQPPHLFKLLLMLHQRAPQQTRRKVPFFHLPCMHELIDNSRLASLGLIVDRKMPSVHPSYRKWRLCFLVLYLQTAEALLNSPALTQEPFWAIWL